MIPMIIIFALLAVTVCVGLAPVFSKKASEKLTVSDYFLGSRGLGVTLIFFTSMATWYSSSLFLGGVAEVYTYGLEWTFVFTSTAIAGLTFYILAPKIQKLAHKKNYITQGDFFADHFNSKALGIIISLIGIICIVPYITIQVVGTGLIFEIFTDGIISFEVGAAIGVAICALFIFYGGMKSVAWTDVFLGVVFLSSIWSVVLIIIYTAFGADVDFFGLAAERVPQLLVLTENNRPWGYFISQIWVIGLGGYMWPHLFLRMVAAKSPKDVRKVGSLITFASIPSQFPVVLGAIAAAILFPALAKPDTALLVMVQEYAPVWMVGVLGAGGIAASLSTINSLAHSQGVLMANDIYVKVFNRQASEKSIVAVSRAFVLITCAVAYVAALTKPDFLWSILANTYSGVIQIFPVTVAALFWSRATAKGCIAGVIAGLITAILFRYVWEAPFGIVAPAMGVIANFIFLVGVSLVTKPNAKLEEEVQGTPLMHNLIERISQDRVVELTKHLIDFDSTNPAPSEQGDLSNETAVATYIAEFFENLGLDVERQYVIGERFNVIATLKGSDVSAPVIAFNGHTDVVPAGEPSLWHSNPFNAEIRDGNYMAVVPVT